MARRAKEEAERTRTRILASALALFAKKGYAQTTFTDIAARLKLTKGAVYWHFASKEALLLALIDDMVARFGRLFAAAMPPGEASCPDVAALLARHTRRCSTTPRRGPTSSFSTARSSGRTPRWRPCGATF